MSCYKNRAYVYLIDYGLYAVADLYDCGDARIVRFNGDLETFGTFTPERQVTHTLYLNNHPDDVWWRKDLGVAVVPVDDLVEVQS
jgi:streptogramin lyase